MEYEKKLGCFYPCTNVNFCILLAFLRCTIQTENFPKISFWVETSNVSDFELNVFQRVKFKNTISKIPRILDWVFYNVPDFESIFFWEGKNFEKKYWIETHHIFIDILQEKDDNFVILFALLKRRIVTKLFIFQSDFELKQLQRVRFWITNFEPVRFCINAFRTCHTLNWFFSEKIRSWKKLWSKKFRFDTFLPVKTTIAAFLLRF